LLKKIFTTFGGNVSSNQDVLSLKGIRYLLEEAKEEEEKEREKATR
jgi:hypothetical protein